MKAVHPMPTMNTRSGFVEEDMFEGREKRRDGELGHGMTRELDG